MIRSKIFIFLVVVIGVFPAYAAHLKGGYIEYENLGPNASNPSLTDFHIRVFQYLDCNSAGGQIDNEIYLGIYNLDLDVLTSTVIVPLSSTVISSKKEFRCIDLPPNVCYRIDSYETIQSLPNNTMGYNLTVQRCCRVSGINNISNSVNSGVTYSVVLAHDQPNSTFIRNSSPVFAREDTALVCAGNSFTLPFKASDPDGDSLVFSFTPGLNTPTREAKPLPPVAPPFPDLIYYGSFSPLEPMGGSVTINRNTGVIGGIAPDNTGDYVVAVLVEEYRNGKKIGQVRKEIHVSVANCSSPRAILPATIVNCDSMSVKFVNQSNSSSITSYNWDFGVPSLSNDTSILPSPIYVYPDTGVYKVKLVINRFGFCSDSTYTEVRIFPGFTPDFSYQGVCNLLPYNFSDKSTARYGSVISWRWNFGVTTVIDDTSRVKNPTWFYSQVGTYNASLIVTSTKGCVDTIVKPVLVSDKPKVDLAFRDTLICTRDSLQLMALGTGNYVWTPNYNIINANSATPLVYPKRTTTYTVTLDNSGCKATDTVRVNTVDFVTLFAGNDTTICLTDGIQFKPISDGNKFVWTPAATLNNANIKNPVATPTATQTTYAVIAFLGNCVANDDIVVNTLPYPTVEAGLDTTICFGAAAFLRGSSNADKVTWSPGNTIQNRNNLNSTAFPANTRYFYLTAQNNTGCTNPISDSVLISVLPRILVDAGPDTSLVVNQPMQLTGSTNVSKFQWSPSLGLSDPGILNPVLAISADLAASLSDPLVYTLTATNTAGCTVSNDVVIRLFITEPSIFVPSGFTPNSDGLNDVIRPVLAGMQSLSYFRVYNRYGQLIFETKQVGRGWDGKVKGELQATGAYVYDCQAIDYRGTTSRAKGTFVLIR